MNLTNELLRSIGCPSREAFEARKEQIKALLLRSDEAVRQAILRVHDRQTADEKACDETKHLNGVGFQACDARFGGFVARLVRGGHALYPDRMDRARRMAVKYSAQLTVLSFLKEQAKATTLAPGQAQGKVPS